MKNNLAFYKKAPVPADSWAPRVRDATKYGPSCIGVVIPGLPPQPMDEDCLFINVYVPGKRNAHHHSQWRRFFKQRFFSESFDTAINITSKLAAMVHIHGGTFESNSGDDAITGPDFLVEHNVIVMAFNYRLGPFGFASFGTPVFSGNQGMKDMQLALKWIHDNIHYFGGNNQKITLSGHSSGECAFVPFKFNF